MSQKKKALTLTIPEPCSEKFDKMTPVKGGKFCDACDKTIVDFRTLTDRQILNHYEKNKGKICGVFKDTQLNRAIPFPIERRPANNWKAIAALTTGLLFGGFNASAQVPTMGKIAIEQTITLGETEVQQEQPSTPDRVIKGYVKSQIDGEALVGANIIIEDTAIGSTTDINGFFELKIPQEFTEIKLGVYYMGFDEQILVFNKNNPITNQDIIIELTAREYHIMGIMVPIDLEREDCDSCEEGEEVEIIPEIIPDTEVKKEMITENQMTIFPNPFTNNFKVSYNFEAKGDYLFHLYDVNGRLLFAKSYQLLKGEQTVDLEMSTQLIQASSYIVQVSDSQDRILATKKVVKG